MPNIARPFRGDQQFHRFGGIHLPFLIRLLRNLLQKVRDQQGNIFAPIVQRRQADLDYVEPIVEVFAEFARAHHFLQVAVRSRDDADINIDRFGAADRSHLVFLQDAQ